MKIQHGWAFPSADEFMSNAMKPDGSYQASHLVAALEYVTDWSLSVDGGAHAGTWTKTLSQRFTRVISVEPSTDTFEALQANVLHFGCLNVQTLNVALGDKPGTVKMVLDGRAAEMHNTGGRYAAPGGDILVETIDSWDLKSLGFLKLDVEGSEVAALRGARKTLKRCRPIVLYEEKGFSRRYGEVKEAAAKLLESFGFRLLQVVGCDRIWGPR
jgi:FkbM family methyltransferase